MRVNAVFLSADVIYLEVQGYGCKASVNMEDTGQ